MQMVAARINRRINSLLIHKSDLVTKSFKRGPRKEGRSFSLADINTVYQF